MKFVMMFLMMLVMLVMQASAANPNIRVNRQGDILINKPGIGGRTFINNNSHHGNNNAAIAAAIAASSHHGHNHNFGINNFGFGGHNHHRNNIAFVPTRPAGLHGFNGFAYAPPVSTGIYGVPTVTFDQFGRPIQVRPTVAYGNQVLGVGFANPGCGRAILGY